MNLAIKESRMILTFDKDYGELIFKQGYKPESAVIFLRLESYEREEPGKIIDQLLSIPHFGTNKKPTFFDGKFIGQRVC